MSTTPLAQARSRASLSERIQQLWWPASSQALDHAPDPALGGLALTGLAGLAAVYGALTRLRMAAYQQGWLKQRRLSVPTLVVGNRIVGGAGKTPVTLALVEALRSRGWQPGIISRGYGRKLDAVQAVDPLTSTPAEVGDEPLLMARRSGVPVWVGRDRHAAGLALLAAHPEIQLLICDDGLQHLALARELEVIVWDERSIGNGRLLPRGPLREALDTPSTARKRWSLHNLGDTEPQPDGWRLSRSLAPAQALTEWWRGEGQAKAQSWDEMRKASQDEAWVAVAGIGSPERFFRALEAQGLRIERRACADHADFSDALPFGTGDHQVIVTEKDAIKLDPRRVAALAPGVQVWVVPLVLHLPPSVVDEIDMALRSC